MRSIFLTVPFLLIFISFAESVVAQQTIAVNDTRNTSEIPHDFRQVVSFDFKPRAIVGVSGNGPWSTNMTIAPWSDASGGKNHQLNFNDGGIYYRIGDHLNPNWESWKRMLIEESNGNVGIRTSNPIAALQIGDFLNNGINNHLLIPGVYNFEQVRLGQINNGNSALEFVNHTGVGSSYGMRLLVDTDHGAQGMQFQYAPVNTSYEALSYLTGLYMSNEGRVGINTTSIPRGYKLAIAGNMIAESVTVKLQAAWPDYVFKEGYHLPNLAETERSIKETGHLPGMPSAIDVRANGIDLGEMNAKLLQKVEELTLYLIKKDKKDKQQTREIDLLKREIGRINKKVR